MDLHTTLRKQLDKARPHRYSESEKQWVDDVADGLHINLSEQDMEAAARSYVRRAARDLEGQATKGGNRLLRHFHSTGQLPIDWAMYGDMPISLENKVLVAGKEEIVKERVKLAHATHHDFEMWAETEQRARERDYNARGAAVQGALQIALEMKSAGVLTFAAWAQEFAPVEESAA
ncbi:hypothetical protein ACEE23_01840 [Corynebacterium sp. 32222D000AT]